jgi:hypothetical protein
MTPDSLYGILQQRSVAPQNIMNLVRGLGPAQGMVTDADSKATRITTRIAFDNGRQMGAEAVILLNEGEGDPYYVLSWHDAADDVPASGRAP